MDFKAVLALPKMAHSAQTHEAGVPSLVISDKTSFFNF